MNDLYYELSGRGVRDKTLEPTATTRDRSVREMELGPHHIRHRFPFPGSISLADLIRSKKIQNDALLGRLRAKGIIVASGPQSSNIPPQSDG